MMMQRMTARKVPLSVIEQGTQQENIVATSLGGVGRVRIFGTIVKKFVSQKYSFFLIDDTTACMQVKVFNDPSKVESLKEGSMVDVIGRIREFNGVKYVALESVFPITDPNFMTLRLLEMVDEAKKVKKLQNLSGDDALEFMKNEGLTSEVVQGISQTSSGGSEDDRKKVLELITSLDSGSGVSYSDVVSASGMSEVAIEGVINSLLGDGTCYEPKPGFIKKL